MTGPENATGGWRSDRGASCRGTLRRRVLLPPVFAALLLLAGHTAAVAQQAPKSAAEVADEYLRGIEAMAWRATAQRIHPDALERLRETLRIMIEPDKTGRLLRVLGGGLSEEDYLARDGETLFASVMSALRRESPGIINAMTDRETEVIGTVAEGDSLRYAVYRLEWRLQGAEPEIKVMTLAPDARGRWKVLWAPELESLRSALLGIVLERPPPGAAMPEGPGVPAGPETGDGPDGGADASPGGSAPP